jgi:hypothetical protein
MLSKAKSCASQGTCSVRKKKRKNKLYYSSKKALEKSRMRTSNRKFNFRGPSRLIDFRNSDVADIASIIDDVL